MKYSSGDASTDLFNLSQFLNSTDCLSCTLDGDEAERLGFRMGWLEAIAKAASPLTEALVAAGTEDESVLEALGEYREAVAALERGPLNG